MSTEKSLHKSFFLFQASQTTAVHQLREDDGKQSLQQRKDNQAAEEGVRIQTDPSLASDKQEARGRSRDIKRAENQLRQRRRLAVISAEEKRAIQEKVKLRQKLTKKEMSQERKWKVQEEDKIQHDTKRKNITEEEKERENAHQQSEKKQRK